MGRAPDRYYLCGLCNEAALLRGGKDSGIRLNPYYVEPGKTAPGFVSLPDFERHLRAQHCLPCEGSKPPPPLLLKGPSADDDDAEGSSAAAAAAGPANNGRAAADAAASEAADAAIAAAIAKYGKLSARQQQKVLADAAKEVHHVEVKESHWGQPGSGDGHIEIRPKAIMREKLSKYRVEWEYLKSDCTDGVWTDEWIECGVTSITTGEMKVLRRTAPPEVLAGLDEPATADSPTPAEEAPAAPAAEEATPRDHRAPLPPGWPPGWTPERPAAASAAQPPSSILQAGEVPAPSNSTSFDTQMEVDTTDDAAIAAALAEDDGAGVGI